MTPAGPTPAWVSAGADRAGGGMHHRTGPGRPGTGAAANRAAAPAPTASSPPPPPPWTAPGARPPPRAGGGRRAADGIVAAPGHLVERPERETSARQGGVQRRHLERQHAGRATVSLLQRANLGAQIVEVGRAGGRHGRTPPRLYDVPEMFW